MCHVKRCTQSENSSVPEIVFAVIVFCSFFFSRLFQQQTAPTHMAARSCAETIVERFTSCTNDTCRCQMGAVGRCYFRVFGVDSQLILRTCLRTLYVRVVVCLLHLGLLVSVVNPQLQTSLQTLL